MDDLTLLIPAKQESESLPKVLDELKKYNYKINIILDKDDYQTINSVKNYNVNIIHQKYKGYGDALIHGINSCDTKYFCIFNADGSFNPIEINKILQKLKSDNLDFVFASRYTKNGGSEDDTIITLIGNYIFSSIGKIFFKLNISDILYTFVIGVTKKAKLLELKYKDFGLCVELPIKAKKLNYKLDDFPSYERKRIAGKKKVNAFFDGLKILISMMKLYLK